MINPKNCEYTAGNEISKGFTDIKISPTFDKYYLFNSYQMLLSNLGRCKQILTKISKEQLSFASAVYTTHVEDLSKESNALGGSGDFYYRVHQRGHSDNLLFVERFQIYENNLHTLIESIGVKVSPYYLKLLRIMTEHLKSSGKNSSATKFGRIPDDLDDHINNYCGKLYSFKSTIDEFLPPVIRLTSSPVAIASKFVIAIYTLYVYLGWYNYSKVLYSFKSITSLEALNIIREDSTFKPSDLYEIFNDNTPLAIQIVNHNKTIRSVGLISRSPMDSISVYIAYSENESYSLEISKDTLLSCKSFDSLFENLNVMQHSYNIVTSVQAFNPWEACDTESCYDSSMALKEISIEELLYTENSVFNLVASMLALGYYLTFKPRINPDRERINSSVEVNTNASSESDGTILHYDIAESTISIVAPKKDIIDFDAKGTPKKPHYRRGHSHRYWEGTGEDKKLVKHYVAGYGVNGYEPTEEDLKPKALIKNISILTSSNEDSTSFFN